MQCQHSVFKICIKRNLACNKQQHDKSDISKTVLALTVCLIL